MDSEKAALTAKIEQLENKIELQENSHKEKNNFLQQKHSEVESRLTDILFLHKELSNQFSS